MKRKYRNPLSRSLLLGCIALILFLCISQTAASFIRYNFTMYQRYEQYLRDLLRYTASEIDVDDLKVCIESGQKSEKYEELQQFIDQVKEYHDIHYLYIVKPLNTDDKDNMMNVMEAMTKEERTEHPEEAVELGNLSGEEYSSKVAKEYLNSLNGEDEVTYFEDASQSGMDLTGALPVFDSSGEPVAVVAADIDTGGIRRLQRNYLIANLCVITLLGLLVLGLAVFWLRRRIILPIQKLEESVNHFAEASRNQGNLREIQMELPQIQTGDEIESLALSVHQMSQDIMQSTENLVQVERKVKSMKDHATEMDALAYNDSLTHVKNKTAYHKIKKKLDWYVFNRAAEFALVMVDLNFLKRVNDNYGHERGDFYIQHACKLVCEVYAHSPVFRIGGDEFLVILENEDYKNRDALFEELTNIFQRNYNNKDLEEWERASAAVGMAIFEKEKDKCVDDVFKRADQAMYENKIAMKAGRE